jgi:DNA-binding IclR family transcriptional regulator
MKHAEVGTPFTLLLGTPCLSHNIFVPEQTTTLEPFAKLRMSGQLHNTAKSAVRALEIVELLTCAGRPLRAFEISQALDISPSSADQLLKTLVDSAYLIFDPHSKYYHLSPRLSKLGAELATAYFRPGAIEQFIDAVHRDLRRAVYLLTCQGSYMQTIDKRLDPASPPFFPDGFDPDPGVRIPLFGSSSGVAWLATQTHDVVCAAISRCRRELGRLAKNPSLIFEAVRRVRERGLAVGGLIAHGRCGTAIALPPARNGIVLVLSVSRPLDEVRARPEAIIRGLNSRIDEFLR